MSAILGAGDYPWDTCVLEKCCIIELHPQAHFFKNKNNPDFYYEYKYKSQDASTNYRRIRYIL
jgi:hypothetical protein